jgi:spore maturation protein CgeB
VRKRIVIVGNSEEIHIGAHLYSAARELGIVVEFCDMMKAYDGFWILTKFNWWVRGHRPNRLRAFSREVVNACKRVKPQCLLVTGIAPVDEKALKEIGEMDVEIVNYLTDNPWNPVHNAPWFIKTISCYDKIFYPRYEGVKKIRDMGCQKVEYLPFAYAPKIHFPEPGSIADEKMQYDHDVVFVGGADSDRHPYIVELIREGYNVGLYGGYWNRFTDTKKICAGHLGPREMRKAVSSSKVALCLVRHANKDETSMRSFEVPAIGACMLTEDTRGHREIFGEDNDNVIYFRDKEEMVEKLRYLMNNPQERQRLSRNVHELISTGKHTYTDRLKKILGEIT